MDDYISPWGVANIMISMVNAEISSPFLAPGLCTRLFPVQGDAALDLDGLMTLTSPKN